MNSPLLNLFFKSLSFLKDLEDKLRILIVRLLILEKDMDIQKIVKGSFSCSEVARKIGHKYTNGKIIKEVKNILEREGLDFSHFKRNGNSQLRYEHIEKKCPVCKKKFIALKDHPREKQTCSYACSNTYFRSGPDNGGWKEDAYRTTCFYYHKKQCVICDEKNIVEVHHLDENNQNHKPSNLVPMCPTHHQYWHSRYKYLIEKKVLYYIKNWIKNGDSPSLVNGT